MPQAAISLAVLLRQTEALSIPAALAAESAVYSMLQAGPEFAAWRAATPARPDPDPDRTTVLIDRDGDRLSLTLDRPHRHNAISMRLRDELHAALTIAVVDDSIREVVVGGNGPSFCSGGDLGEFGSRPDPVTAHVTRLARSPAALIERLRDRVEMRIHGSTFGGGIEMAAFAGRVIADSGHARRASGGIARPDPRRRWHREPHPSHRTTADRGSRVARQDDRRTDRPRLGPRRRARTRDVTRVRELSPRPSLAIPSVVPWGLNLKNL